MKVALVTGANTGIGFAIATRLLADGFALGYATRDADQGPFDELQGTIEWVVGDLSDPAVPERLVAERSSRDLLIFGSAAPSGMA